MCSQTSQPSRQSSSSAPPSLARLSPSLSPPSYVPMWSKPGPASMMAVASMSANPVRSSPASPMSSTSSMSSNSLAVPLLLTPTIDNLPIPLQQQPPSCDTPSGRFAALVSILLLSLESTGDPANNKLRVQAKALVKECVRRNAMGDPHFSPLQSSMLERLRGLVGEARWARAQTHWRVYISSRNHTTTTLYSSSSSSSSMQSRDDHAGGQVTGECRSMLKKRTGSHLSSVPLPFEYMMPLIKKEEDDTTAASSRSSNASLSSLSSKPACKRRRVVVDATQEEIQP